MKNKLIKSTIILMIGGIITKILGMINRIIMSRYLGDDGIGLYMILMPTFSLFIALAQIGLPIAISKLVSENNKNNKKLVFSNLVVAIIINFFIIIFLIFFSSFIADYLLKQPILKNSIICIGLVLPFIAISSILRGYFFGKEKMIPHVISNIIEDLVRLLLIGILLPLFLKKGINYAISFIILSNIVSEITSIIILLFFLPKTFKIKKDDLIPSKTYMKKSLGIGLPATISRLIGSFGYFLEPIILTYFLSFSGYSNSYIIKEYGIVNGYVMPLILLPSFFSMAISNALLPIISKSYSNSSNLYTKSKIKQGIFFCLLIGIPFTIFIIINPNILLKFLYNTKEGINYIRFFAPFCILHYIQAPLTSSMQAMNLSKEAMYHTLVGSLIRTISLIILSLCHIGIYSLLISTSINIFYVTIMHYLSVKKALKK